jgi:hypothetical protein
LDKQHHLSKGRDLWKRSSVCPVRIAGPFWALATSTKRNMPVIARQVCVAYNQTMRIPLLILATVAVGLCRPISTQAAEPTAAAKSAQEIRIPKVEFREATLREAIAFLSKKSVEIDPQKRGVNIAIAGKFDPEAKISLSVIDASLYEILTVVAGQSGTEIVPSETILMLVSKAK